MSLGRDPARSLLADVNLTVGGPLRNAMLLMLAGALAEGIGLLSLLPLLSSAGGGKIERVATLIPSAIDPFIALLVLFVTIMIVRALILLARDRAIARLENDYDVSLRLRAATTLAARGWPFAAGIGQAGMQTLLANDVPRSGYAIHQALNAATALFLLVVLFVVAALLSPIMALGAIVLLSLGLPWQIALTRRGRASGVDIVEGQDDATHAAYTFHAGLKAAMAQGSVGGFLAAYGSALDRLAGQFTGYADDLARARTRHAVAAAIGASLVVGAGHWLALDLPRLLALLILFARMSGPAQGLQQAWVGLVAYAPSFAAIEARLGPLATEAEPPAASPPPLDWSRLSLERVGLRRPDGFVLAPVDLSLSPGEWVAMLGPSGVGKTTLLDIIAGLIDPTEGVVNVDGAPLEVPRLAAWRAGISYVGQQEVPVEATVADALGSASEAEHWQALEIVGLGTTIRATAAGLALPLDDRGARLSGGERQRLLIAHALLRRPRLLMLDEATAAIDVTGERVDRARPGGVSRDGRTAGRPSCGECCAVRSVARNGEPRMTMMFALSRFTNVSS